VPARVRKRLAASAQAFSVTARNPSLLRAQLAFGGIWAGEWVFSVALAVVAFRDGGATAVGIVAFVRWAPGMLAAPVGSAFADRFPRHRVLVSSCLVWAAATAAAALALSAGGPIVGVYALALLATTGLTVFRPVHAALLPALCKTPLELTSANMVRGLVDSLSALLGPLAAALLLGLGSPAAAAAATAVLALTSAVLLMGLAYEAPPHGRPEQLRRIARETVDGFRALRRYRAAGLLFGVVLAQTLTRGFLNVFVVVLALELLGTGEPGVGVLTAAVGAGAVAGSLGVSTCVIGRRLAALAGLGVALWGIPLTLTGALPYAPMVLALMGVIGVANALVDVTVLSLVPRLVPEEMLARVHGAFQSLVVLTIATGSLVTPLAIDLLGVRGALAALGLIAPGVVVLARGRLAAIDASIAHRDEKVEVLRRVDMLHPLPMPAIDSLALHAEHAHVAASQMVVNQDDRGDRFYVIEHGEAEVLGDGRRIRTLGPGDCFGEIALLHDTRRTATVWALSPLRLYTLDRDPFLSSVNGYQSSAREALALVDDRLGIFDPRASTSA
jgi:MFS family permease